jgi:hypothetical protein
MIRDTRMQRETGDRLFNAQRLGEAPEAAALKGLMGRTQGSIEANPLTRQKADVDEWMGQRQEALSQGYSGSNPVAEMNVAARKQKEYEKAGPERVADITGKADIERQRLASEATLRGKELDIEADKNNPLLQMLRGGLGGSRSPQSFSIPGMGSINMGVAPKAAPKLSEDVTLARRAYENAKGKKWFGMEPGPEKVTLDATIAAYMANHPASPDIKQFAKTVASRPDTSKMSFDQILQATGEDALDDNEKSQLYDLLSVIRGF